jgi:transposase
MNQSLFDKGEAPLPSLGAVAAAEAGEGKPRLRVPQRNQIEMHWLSLDELLEPDHPVRSIWAAVCGLNLRDWLGEIKAVEGVPGRNATDPRLLAALWIYATLEAIGSARELARLCEKHLAYKWLCGGVSLNYHLLADFRAEGDRKLDALLTQIVASLEAEGLVTMKRVAQDGMRVRASAGKGSFRRKPRLEQLLEGARQQVETLRRLAEESPDALTKGQRAARERAVRERQERIEEAIRNCEQLQQERDETSKKSGRKPPEARASTTDAVARTMKFADGGYHPGYNVQFGTDTASGVIGGVDVVKEGSDLEQLPPMLAQLENRYDRGPDEALVDGGFASLEAIEQADGRGCTVYAPLKDEARQLAAGKNPYQRKKGDSAAVAAWRERMGTAGAKLLYRLRSQTAEWVNALCRNRGLRQMPVRGLPKCRAVVLWYAIAHNIVRGMQLRAAAAAGAP